MLRATLQDSDISGWCRHSRLEDVGRGEEARAQTSLCRLVSPLPPLRTANCRPLALEHRPKCTQDPAPFDPRTGVSPFAMSLSHLQWRATEWLLAFGPLSPAIVMDYFVMSPFFDRTSNNAVLRMQMQYSRGGMEGVDEEAELKCVGACC